MKKTALPVLDRYVQQWKYLSNNGPTMGGIASG
jgi:hypothetical protein